MGREVHPVFGTEAGVAIGERALQQIEVNLRMRIHVRCAIIAHVISGRVQRVQCGALKKTIRIGERIIGREKEIVVGIIEETRGIIIINLNVGNTLYRYVCDILHVQ